MKLLKKGTAVFCTALILLLSGCGKTDSSESTPKSANQSAGTMFSDRDLDPSYDESAATKISLSDAGVQIEGTGASAESSTVTVSSAGTYILSGALTDGQITVDAEKTDKIQLVFKNADITSTTGPAIYVKSADKVFLTIDADTENSLSDSASYADSSDQNNPDGAVFSQDDLTLNGTGKLTVNGNYKHGVVSKDDLVITGGEITVTAAKDGLQGKDSVRVGGGSLNIAAGSDGIISSNDEETENGFVYIADGSLNISAQTDGIQATNYVEIKNGNISVVSGGGSANALSHKNNDMPVAPGTQTEQTWNSEESDTQSMKGIKAGNDIRISGGNLSVDSADDSVHSNGTAALSGGDISLTSGDDGVHADAELTVSGGNVSILNSYEGLEGKNITVSGGNISIKASDDGMNAAGGSDGSSVNGRAGQNPFDADPDAFINISGGYIIIDADGDGVDSNGSMTVSGGVMLISGPVNGGDGALDSEERPVITGGTVIAAGSVGMAETFSEDSSQCSISYNVSGSAGERISLVSSNGDVILSFAPAKQYGNVVMSSANMKQGESYTVYLGGNAASADQNGFADEGTLNDGEKQEDITLSQISNSAGTQGGSNMGRMPDGNGPSPDSSDNPPQKPDSGDMPERPDGQTPPDRPDMPGGGQSQS